MQKLTSFCRFFKIKEHSCFLDRFNSVNITRSRYCHSKNTKKSKTRSFKNNGPVKPFVTQENNKMNPSSSFVSYGGTYTVSDDVNVTPSRSKIPLNFRSWKNMVSTVSELNCKFKVMSYNVLAQCAVTTHPHLYQCCSEDQTSWPSRFERLYAEITLLDPDIICLQEVQASHLDNFFFKINQLGYSSVYKQKTGNKEDGCAIYFRNSLFKLHDFLNVEFYQPMSSMLDRHNVGMMVRLAPTSDPANMFVVATTHLLYNPRREDVRLAQSQLFLAEIDRFSFYTRATGCGHYPIILTGDLNSGPESTVVKLYSYGHINASCRCVSNSDIERIGITDNCQHLAVYLDRRAHRHTAFNDLRIYNTEYCERGYRMVACEPGPLAGLFNSGDIYHALNLRSVYSMRTDSGAWEATTSLGWTMVDYMFYSGCGPLRLTARLQLPAREQCEELYLPNDIYGSDHLCLVAAFELSPQPMMSS